MDLTAPIGRPDDSCQYGETSSIEPGSLATRSALDTCVAEEGHPSTSF
jgi:hypothetical protein